MHLLRLIGLIAVILLGTEIYAQTPETVHFEYDGAGNRIARFVYRSMMQSESDSLAMHNEKVQELLNEEEEPEAEKAPTQAFKIYPNPTRAFFVVDHTNGSDELWEYRLFNGAGVMAAQGTLNRLPYQIDVGDIPQGTYYLRLSSPTETQTFSIIKL